MAESPSSRKNPAGCVYFNGEIMPADAARLPVDDVGVLFGCGFFETFRTSGGRPHHWRFHRERLAAACATAGIRVPERFLARDDRRLRESVRALLEKNKMSEAVFRYTLTAGRAPVAGNRPIFVQPSELLTLRALPPAAPARGISLRVLRLTRDNGEWLPRPKSLNYANALAGAGELQRRTSVPSDEGLFLSRDGRFVVETTRQNLAWIDGGKLCFPEPALGAVAGTGWQWVSERGLPAEPRRARLDEFLAADAIVVINAVRGVTPVRELWDERDRRRLGSFASHAHPVVQQLQREWNDALRKTARAKR